MQPKHLVDARSHTFTPKASLSISSGAQGQVLWLAGAGCESGAARYCRCGNVARRWQAVCSDSCIKGLRSFFSSWVCFWQHRVLQYRRWGKGSQHEKGGFKAITFKRNSTEHYEVKVKPLVIGLTLNGASGLTPMFKIIFIFLEKKRRKKWFYLTVLLPTVIYSLFFVNRYYESYRDLVLIMTLRFQNRA